MIIGILICGIALGICLATIALLMGYSLLCAIILYTSGGIFGVAIGAGIMLLPKRHN